MINESGKACRWVGDTLRDCRKDKRKGQELGGQTGEVISLHVDQQFDSFEFLRRFIKEWLNRGFECRTTLPANELPANSAAAIDEVRRW